MNILIFRDLFMSIIVVIDYHWDRHSRNSFFVWGLDKGCSTNLAKYAARSMLKSRNLLAVDIPAIESTQTPLNGVFHGRLLTPYILCQTRRSSSPLSSPSSSPRPPRIRSRLSRCHGIHSGPLSLIVGTFRVRKLADLPLHFNRFYFIFSLSCTMTHLGLYNRMYKEI